MAIRIVRLGDPREPGEGLRVGTVRRLPRGVKKADYARRNFFDIWLPELAPSDELLKWAHAEPLEGKRWTTFERRYRSELREPSARRLLDLFAALSKTTDLSVGCYCEDASHCHRTPLGRALAEHGADVE